MNINVYEAVEWVILILNKNDRGVLKNDKTSVHPRLFRYKIIENGCRSRLVMV